MRHLHVACSLTRQTPPAGPGAASGPTTPHSTGDAATDSTRPGAVQAATATTLSPSRHLSTASVRGVTSPAPLASGRDADVFALDALRVLRRYRRGGEVAAEAAVMGYVAELGFPVPTVYEADGADLVMERIDGPTLLQALVAGRLDAGQGGVLLAGLHRQLHQLPPRLSVDSTDRILHLDLHPGNIMLSRRGPLVIDWSNTTEGPADLDVALTALILAQVAVDATEMAPGAGELLTEFLRSAGGDPVLMLDRAEAMRRHDLNLTGEEVGLLPSAVALVAQSA